MSKYAFLQPALAQTRGYTWSNYTHFLSYDTPVHPWNKWSLDIKHDVRQTGMGVDIWGQLGMEHLQHGIGLFRVTVCLEPSHKVMSLLPFQFDCIVNPWPSVSADSYQAVGRQVSIFFKTDKKMEIFWSGKSFILWHIFTHTHTHTCMAHNHAHGIHAANSCT